MGRNSLQDPKECSGVLMWSETLAQHKPTHLRLEYVCGPRSRGAPNSRRCWGAWAGYSPPPVAYCRGFAEAARAEASTKALASALRSVRGVKLSVGWRAAQDSFCPVSSSQGAPRNLGLCGCSQPVFSQNRQPQGSPCLRQTSGRQDYLLSFPASEEMGVRPR